MIRVNKVWHRNIVKALKLALAALEVPRTSNPRVGENLFPGSIKKAIEAMNIAGKLLRTKLGSSKKSALSNLFETSVSNISNSELESTALHQRRLFEILLVTIALTRAEIIQNAEEKLFYEHFALAREAEHLRLRKADVDEFYGKNNSELISKHSFVLSQLEELEKQIDKKLCIWWRSKKLASTKSLYIALFESAEVTPLEREGMGLTYRSVFGTASDRIHFNLAIADLSKQTQLFELQAALQSIVLMACAFVLRLVTLAETSGIILSPESIELKRFFSTNTPWSSFAAKQILANIGDVVWTVSESGSFAGIVKSVDVPNNWKYISYEVENPITAKSDWYTSFDIQLLVSNYQYQDFVESLSVALDLPFGPHNARNICQFIETANHEWMAARILQDYAEQQATAGSIFV